MSLTNAQRAGLRTALDELLDTEQFLKDQKRSMDTDEDWREVFGERYASITKAIRVVEGLLKGKQGRLPI